MPIYKQNTKVGEVIDKLKDVGERFYRNLLRGIHMNVDITAFTAMVGGTRNPRLNHCEFRLTQSLNRGDEHA